MTEKVSLVYKNIFIYRIIINILYGLKYKKRFENVVNLIANKDQKILELCFGDIYIAEFAKNNNKIWTGYDINQNFISFAKKGGYNAINKDIIELKSFPKSDVCIIIGSLYHFIHDLENILTKMLESSSKVIISEPIKNLSDHRYIGFFAKKLANAGKGDEQLRFNEHSFLDILNKYKDKLSFNYKIVSIDRDILVIINKNEK